MFLDDIDKKYSIFYTSEKITVESHSLGDNTSGESLISVNL